MAFRQKLNICWIYTILEILTLEKSLKKAQCLKITEKVSFNIASEASYVYILSGQKLIKNAKIQMGHFNRFSNNVKRYSKVLKGWLIFLRIDFRIGDVVHCVKQVTA